MRKLVIYSLIFAATSFSFISCNNETLVPDESHEGELFEYQFALGSENDGTKAILSDATVSWQSGDYLGVVAKYTGGSYSYANDNTKSQITPASGETPAKFMVKTWNALTAGGQVFCFFPYVTGSSFTTPTVELSFPESQKNTINEMPMASIPFTVTSDVPAKTGTDVGEIRMVMLGSIARFNIYTSNDSYAGETIQSVKFTANKAIAGSGSINLENIDYDSEATMTISGYSAKTITETVNQSVASGKANAVEVNMVVAPGDYTGTIVVKTNEAEYTYTISEAKSFARAHIKPFSVDLAKGDRQTPKYFREVTSSKDDYSGTYLIVHEYSNSAVAYKGKSDATGGSVQKVSKSEGVILATDALISEAVTITKEDDTYYAQNSEGKYLYMPATTSSLGVQDTKTAISIVFDSGIQLQSTTGTIGTSLRAKDNDKIKFYTSSSNPLVHYYVLDGTDVVDDPNLVSLSISDVEVTSITKNVTVNISCNKPWKAVANSSFLTDGGFDITGEPTEKSFSVTFAQQNTDVQHDKVVEVTVSAGDGEYYKEKTITVTQKAPIAKITATPANQNVASDATSASFKVQSGDVNFEWSVLSITVDGVSASNEYTAIKDEDGETVNVSFPVNESETESTNDKVIVVTVGNDAIKTATHTITQSGKIYEDPDARFYTLVKTVPSTLNGKYILAYGTKAYNGIGDDRLSAAEGTLEISDGKILSSDATDALAIDIYGTTNNYYMLFPDGNFLSMDKKNSAIPSTSVYMLTGFSVSDNEVSITGNDGADDRVLVNNGGKVAFYKTSSASSYTLPKLYRLSGSEKDVTEFKQFVVSCENEDIAVAAAGGTKTIKLTCPNVAWTASQTGGATLSSVSGTGNGTITVTIPENKSETETPKYTVKVATTDTGVPSALRSKVFTFTQSKKSSNTLKVDDVMWSETWTDANTATAGSDTAKPSTCNSSGTTVYNSGTVTYSESANTVYVRNEKLAGGDAPELMLSSSKTWTIANIPTAGVSELTLTYLSNNAKSSVSSTTNGVEVTGSSKSYTIKPNGAATITLVFGCSGNTRIDNVELKVSKL